MMAFPSMLVAAALGRNASQLRSTIFDIDDTPITVTERGVGFTVRRDWNGTVQVWLEQIEFVE